MKNLELGRVRYDKVTEFIFEELRAGNIISGTTDSYLVCKHREAIDDLSAGRPADAIRYALEVLQKSGWILLEKIILDSKLTHIIIITPKAVGLYWCDAPEAKSYEIDYASELYATILQQTLNYFRVEDVDAILPDGLQGSKNIEKALNFLVRQSILAYDEAAAVYSIKGLDFSEISGPKVDSTHGQTREDRIMNRIEKDCKNDDAEDARVAFYLQKLAKTFGFDAEETIDLLLGTVKCKK